MIILDTNIISELMRQSPSEKVTHWLKVQASLNEIAVTAITVAEICRGIYRLPDGGRRAELEKKFSHFLSSGFENRVLPFDSNAAFFFGLLAAERERNGQGIDGADLMIAGIAAYHQYSIATRNKTDFEGLGIELINPWTD